MIWDAAKAAIAPYRLYAEIAAVVIAGIAFTWYRASLIEQGVEQKTADDAALTAARIIHNTKVETRAKTLADAHIETFKNSLNAPPAPDAPHLSCVSNNSRTRAVPTDARSRPNTDAATEQPAMVPVPSEDLGPEIDKRFQDDDALIAVLQDRIALEVGICR